MSTTDESTGGSRTTRGTRKQEKCIFQPGDRIVLHSFHKAHWLEGITANVVDVFGEARGGRRRDRVKISYDDISLVNKKEYPTTISLANVRHQ